jgi:hypothetical protein
MGRVVHDIHLVRIALHYDTRSIVAEAVAVVQVVLEADLQKLEQIIIVVDYQLGFSTTQEAF